MTAKAPTERGAFNPRETSRAVDHSVRKPLKTIDEKPLPTCERVFLNLNAPF